MHINFDNARGYTPSVDGDMNALVGGMGAPADDSQALYHQLLSIADDLSLDDPILELEDLM